MTEPQDDLKAFLDRTRDRRERNRPCCKNCAWFGGGACFRNPPVRVNGGWDRPVVTEDELCGEFMHRTTGDTFKGDSHRLSALRALVGDLQDKVDRMREARG